MPLLGLCTVNYQYVRSSLFAALGNPHIGDSLAEVDMRNMKQRIFRISQHNDILPAVSGRVFHVTPTENMHLIKKSGALFPNSDLLHTSKFGNTSNGFFRLRGCVSFFDYRCFESPHWEEHAYKCFPTQILSRGDTMSSLFLHESEYAMLIPWTAWREQEAWSERVVPWVEAGYKGKVSLRSISEELIVEYV